MSAYDLSDTEDKDYNPNPKKYIKFNNSLDDKPEKKRKPKQVKVEPEVKPANGRQIAEIRNLFTPILNFFTMDGEINKIGLSVAKEDRKIIAELTKKMIQEKKLIRKNKNADKIKTLLDELG